MNSHGKYIEGDDKKNVRLENVYSVESVSNVGKVSGEYFEEDDETNVKIEEQDFQDENIEIEKRIPNGLNTKKSCNICIKSYKTKQLLERHVQVVHSGIKYPCNWCIYKATTKGSLKTHVQSVHEKIKYSCNQCDHQATQKGDLKKHIQSVHEKIHIRTC